MINIYTFTLNLLIKNNIKLFNLEIRSQLNNAYDDIRNLIPRDLSSMSRKARRCYNKLSNKTYNSVLFKKITNLSNILSSLDDGLKFRGYLKSEEEYAIFAYFLFNSKMEGSNVEIESRFRRVAIDKILKKNISKSIKNKVSCELLTCFNSDGTINKDYVSKLYSILSNMHSFLLSNSFLPEKISFAEFKEIFDIDGVIKTYYEELDLKRQIEIENKRKEKIEKNKRKTIDNVVTIEVKKEKIERCELDRYIDSNGVLRNNILDLISYDEFKKLLDQYYISDKRSKEQFLNRYKVMYVNRELESIKNYLSEKERYILERISICDTVNNINLYNGILEYIFLSRNLTENNLRVSMISKMLSSYTVETKSHIRNLVVFPSEEIFDANLNQILEVENNELITPVLKNVRHLLNVLSTQNMDEVISKGKKVFHTIHDGLGEENNFTIGNLKGYRFGPKKTKLCLFRLSVCEENQNTLKDLYNLEFFPSVYLIFGFGNVQCEDEYEMYSRIINLALKNESKILEIANIFAYPFTDETLEEAKKYIDFSNSVSNKSLTLSQNL